MLAVLLACVFAAAPGVASSIPTLPRKELPRGISPYPCVPTPPKEKP